MTAALDRLRPQRRYGACHTALYQIGQWCCDHGTDGRISEYNLRQINFTCEWRVWKRYLDLLVSVGALDRRGPKQYEVAFFTEANLPAYLVEQRIEKRRAARRQARLVNVQKIAYTNPTIPPSYELTGHELIELRSLDLRTNPFPPGSIEAPPTPGPSRNPVPPRKAVSSPKKFSVVAEAKPLEDWRLSLRRIEEKAKANALAREPESAAAPSPPPRPKPRPMPTPPAKAPCRPVRAARMPKHQRPANLGDAVEAARTAGLPPEFGDKLWPDLCRIGAMDGETGYAARSLAWQLNAGNTIRHPQSYFMSIIFRQRRARGLPTHAKAG